MYTWNMRALTLIVQKLWQKLKFLEMKVKGYDQGHKVIDLGVIWKDFISWVYMPNTSMKSLSLTVQKLWPRVKFLDM